MPILKSTACLSLLMLPTWCMAALVTWQNPTPSALTPFDNNAKVVAELAGNQIFLYSHPRQNISFQTAKGLKSYNNVQFTTGAFVVNASPQKILQTIQDYQHYVGLFPTLKKAKILEQQQNIKQVEYEVSVPTPIKVLNFNEDVTIQHHITSNRLSSLFIDSPIQFGLSNIEWFPIDAQRSLITVTHWSDTESVKGFLISTILKAMPEAKVAMPYAVNTFVMESLRIKFNGKGTPNALRAGAVPEKTLTATQYQRLIELSKKTAQPISFVHHALNVPYKHGNEVMRFTTSFQFFNANAEKTKTLLTPTIYQQLFPKYVRKIEMLPNPDKSNDAVIYIRAGLGVITIPFTLRLRFMPAVNNTVDMFAVGGDLRLMKTKMEIDQYQQNSVWKMTSAAQIDETAPFLLRAMRSLPYHDVLPTAAIAKVIADKARGQLNY